MRRTVVIIAILAIATFAAPSNPAFALTTTLRFSPPIKYAVFVLSSYAETNVDTDLAVGQVATNAQRGQGFKLPISRKVARVNLWLKTSGAPTDNLTVQIQTDSGGVPSNTVVTNGTSIPVAGSSVGTSYGWVAFDFTAGSQLPQLMAGTQYHLVLKRSGSVDSANYYMWGADQSSPGYADGAGSVYNTGSWQATSPATDHAFEVTPSFTVDAYVKDVDTTEPCIPPDYMQACGLGAYTLKVQFDQAAVQYVSIANGPFLTSTGRLIQSCYNSFGHDPLNGVVAYTCTTKGDTPGYPTPFGPEGSGVLATLTFIPLAAGTTSLGFMTGYTDTVLADSQGTYIPYTADIGSVTVGIFGNTDSDGDGCTDLEETGDDIGMGGRRNPYSPYDFYDVPVPVHADPTPNGTKDKAVNMQDVVAVLKYVATSDNGPLNGNGVDYDSLKDLDWNGDTVIDDGDKVGLRYDRSVTVPPYLSGPPNGAINLQDLVLILNQVGHGCL